MPTHLSHCGLKPGDLLFWVGDTPFSRLIQQHTASEYSHVAMVMPTYAGAGTVYDCIEAVAGFGVRQMPLDRYLAEYPDQRVDWYALNAQPAQRWAATRYCRSRIGDRYADVRQFARSFTRLGTLVRRLLRLSVDDSPTRQFCSELVSAGLESVGLELPKEPALMSPHDVAELPYVSFVCSICAG